MKPVMQIITYIFWGFIMLLIFALWALPLFVGVVSFLEGEVLTSYFINIGKTVWWVLIVGYLIFSYEMYKDRSGETDKYVLLFVGYWILLFALFGIYNEGL
jgi:hypothetical protein